MHNRDIDSLLYKHQIRFFPEKYVNLNLVKEAKRRVIHCMSSLREDALKMHKENQGKLAVYSKVPLRNAKDLSLAYSPGVAEPCMEIFENESTVYDYTMKGNLVAVVSNGTAVLGLGNIGPKAAMPVMEGKALLFKSFADVDAFPICLDTN